MAEILQVSPAPGNVRGNEILAARQQIRSAFGVLATNKAIADEAIAVNTTEVEKLFGLDAGKGQAFFDRLANILTLATNNSAYKEFVNAIEADYTP